MRWDLLDVESGNMIKFPFWPVQASGVYVIDFADSPRKFVGANYGIQVPYNMGVNEFFIFTLYGWEEQQ